MSNFNLGLSAITPPALPAVSQVVFGTFATSNDGSLSRLEATTANASNFVAFDAGSSGNTSTYSFTVFFANTSNPTTSYFYPAIFLQADKSEYQIVLSRGTGELRGALFIQKYVGGSIEASTILGSPVGVSGTTFTQNQKYQVSIGITGSASTSWTFAVSVQRLGDGMWLTSLGVWSGTPQVALTVSDSSALISGLGRIGLNVYSSAATDAYLYDFEFDNQNVYQFNRNGSSPVLAKGGTYGGWTADALAAPSVCWDGSRYVMTVSLWSVANTQWASAFFTSSDLITWSYVSGSLFAPTGSDYIVGNGGLSWFAGKYYFSFSHYASGAGTVTITLATSSNLTSWTTVADPLVSNGFDSSLSINPQNGRLELWYAYIVASVRTIHMIDSPDGTTWTDRGDFLTPIAGMSADFGEPSVFYVGTTRYLTVDSSYATGYRNTMLAYSISQDTTWVTTGMAISPDYNNAWEAGEVFDCTVIVTNTGDGNGNCPHAIYAGSDTNSSTDDTDSSLGLAALPSLKNNFYFRGWSVE
jgi:hypothetical protein